MANPYSIDYRPLDIGGGLAGLADAYQRAAQNRDLNDMRARELALKERTLSAEEYRKGEEFKIAQEERKRKRETEKIAAYESAARLAQRSPELATKLYKSPFGMSFLKSQDLGPGEEGPQMSPNAPTERPAHPLGIRGEMASLAQGITGVQDVAQPEPNAAYRGNVNLRDRPRVPNEGSVSTIRSMGVNIDGQEVLIPTVSDDGRIMTDDESVAQYRRTGKHLGKFGTVAESNAEAERLHREQEAMGNRWGRDLGSGVDYLGQHEVPPAGPPPVAPVAPPAAPKTRLYADMGTGPTGSWDEVPGPPQSPTGRGPKYDAVYEVALDAFKGDTLKAFSIAEEAYQKDAGRIDAGERARQDDVRAAQARTKQETFQREQDAKYKREPWTFNQEMQLRRAGAAAGATARSADPNKADQGNRQDMASLRQAFKEWKSTVNLSIDSKLQKRLVTASENIGSGNSMQQREAAESLVAIFKGGGQVTKASQELLLNHLSGLVGDAQTWLEHRKTGGYGTRELAVIKEAAENAVKEQREKTHAYYESATDTFGPGSGWEALGGNINHMVRGAFRQFGNEVQDIYAEPGEPVQLGSGKRPRSMPPKGKPRRSDLDELEARVDALGAGIDE